MVTYKSFEVVVVPFPFTDQATSKRRPALVLSSANFNDSSRHGVMAMITTASRSMWPLDVIIRDMQDAGLTHPSLIRMKLFTLDQKLIQRKIGGLSERDQISVHESLTSLLDFSYPDVNQK
ncbi:MAG: type II toxin-antitoxin system PemK/MazF family toxin [Cyanobacteria bacterium P01_F01_bin.42]